MASATTFQRDLFGRDSDQSESRTVLPEWASVTDPEQRLAAFGADRAQPSSKRSEAEGILRLYRQRSQVLDMLGDLRSPEVIPLGVLMLIPEVTHVA